MTWGKYTIQIERPCFFFLVTMLAASVGLLVPLPPPPSSFRAPPSAGCRSHRPYRRHPSHPFQGRRMIAQQETEFSQKNTRKEGQTGVTPQHVASMGICDAFRVWLSRANMVLYKEAGLLGRIKASFGLLIILVLVYGAVSQGPIPRSPIICAHECYVMPGRPLGVPQNIQGRSTPQLLIL